MKFNWTSNIHDYRGLLTFPVTSNVNVQVTIPLYLKEVTLPIRAPKITQINTVPNADPQGYETSVHALFFGTADILSLQLGGFMLTPMTDDSSNPYHPIKKWDPTVDGTDQANRLGLVDWNYGDVIAGYIEGRLNTTSTGRWMRADPISYTDPYGNVYNNPVISQFDWQVMFPKRLQQFNLTLYLQR